MASLRDIRKEDALLRVMRLIEENPQLSSRKLAQKVDILERSGLLCFLTALTEKVALQIQRTLKTVPKKPHAYLITPKGIREKSTMTYKFIERKKMEFNALREEIRILEEEVGLISKEEKIVIKYYQMALLYGFFLF